MPHLGRGCRKLLLGDIRRGEGIQAAPPLGQSAHWPKSLGPTQCYKCITSHLALHFSSFLHTHLEHIRKGSDWFGKCLGNSGHGRWSWKPVGKNMTPRQSSWLWPESWGLPVKDKFPGSPRLLPYPSERPLALPPQRPPFHTCFGQETSLHTPHHYPSPVASADPNHKLSPGPAP